jgi:DNA-binding NarL/FixJ family response regulator
MVDLCIMAATSARRDSLSNCVRGHSEIHVVGIAASFPMLRSYMSDTTPDVVLVDLQSETEHAETADWLLELVELWPIVLLSPGPDLRIFSRIRRADAAGLLQSNASCEQIVQAIKSVAAGLTVTDSTFTTPLADEEPLVEDLTPREYEVLQLLADGLGNKEIASKLDISEHTIKFHIRSILGKLGASSRTEAVARGLRSGLIEL